MDNEKSNVLNTIKRLGYSVADINRKTKIPSARIYKWYSGKGLPKNEDLQLLLKFLEESENKMPTSISGIAVQIISEGKKLPDLPKYWQIEIQHLEDRVYFLQTQNKALIEEINKLKQQLKPNGKV